MEIKNNRTTLKKMEDTFNLMNRRYFDNNLPKPIFKVEDTDDYIGYCKYRENVFHKRHHFTISLSSKYKLSEKAFKTTILHEMIHYYIYYHKIKDNGTHGKKFMEWANYMNNDGYHISEFLNEGVTKVKKSWFKRFFC